MLKDILRCFGSAKQKQWLRWLPWAKYWYNMSFHTATCMTPFEVVYGQALATVHNYEHGTIAIEQVEHFLKKRGKLLKLLKENLATTQNRMKLNEDWH